MSPWANKIYGYALGLFFFAAGMALGIAGWMMDGTPAGRDEWVGFGVVTLSSLVLSALGVFVLHSVRHSQR